MTTLRHYPERRAASGGSRRGGLEGFGRTAVTTDATVTAIHSIPVAEGEAITVRAVVTGRIANLSAAAGAVISATFRRAAAGNVTLVGAVQGATQEDSAGTPAITLAANTGAQTVELRVTGIAAETWTWEAHGDFLKV